MLRSALARGDESATQHLARTDHHRRRARRRRRASPSRDRGELAIVALLTSLYPAATVVLARAFLAERWTGVQAAGLLTSVAAIILVTAS